MEVVAKARITDEAKVSVSDNGRIRFSARSAKIMHLEEGDSISLYREEENWYIKPYQGNVILRGRNCLTGYHTNFAREFLSSIGVGIVYFSCKVAERADDNGMFVIITHANI